MTLFPYDKLHAKAHFLCAQKAEAINIPYLNVNEVCRLLFFTMLPCRESSSSRVLISKMTLNEGNEINIEVN
jgi:hypothetical protein